MNHLLFFAATSLICEGISIPPFPPDQRPKSFPAKAKPSRDQRRPQGSIIGPPKLPRNMVIGGKKVKYWNETELTEYLKEHPLR